MKNHVQIIRSGYDKEKCLVHARCCCAPDRMVATAQYLDVNGSDVFSGLFLSVSTDEGKTWSEFREQPGLSPIVEGDLRTVACDATPMYHKATGKILLLGHTAEYEPNAHAPTGRRKHTFYSVFDRETGEFSRLKFVRMPPGYEICGNGSGQSLELENGELLIPVYYKETIKDYFKAMVMRCSFDGEDVRLLEMGAPISYPISRGAYEPSLVYHKGEYYMTMRNDECGLVAHSKDGLHYTGLRHWSWEDGSLLQNYNTQQHWAQIGDDLYLIYTRRNGDNNHVIRHRAPLFAARVENMRLVRDSEVAIVPQRGARLGNFGVTQFRDGKVFVMAAEWMQPKGCEKYGSDNAIFLAELAP